MVSGEPYIEYELLNSGGDVVPLTDATSIKMNGTPVELEGDTLWFKKTSDTGDYAFEINMKDGIIYSAVILHINSKAHIGTAKIGYSTVQ